MYLNSRVPSLNASDCVRLDRSREQSGNETETTTRWNQEVKKKSRETHVEWSDGEISDAASRASAWPHLPVDSFQSSDVSGGRELTGSWKRSHSSCVWNNRHVPAKWLESGRLVQNVPRFLAVPPRHGTRVLRSVALEVGTVGAIFPLRSVAGAAFHVPNASDGIRIRTDRLELEQNPHATVRSQPLRRCRCRRKCRPFGCSSALGNLSAIFHMKINFFRD